MPTSSTIGMSVPGALSPAGAALFGTGPASLAEQVSAETDEEKKRRLAALRAQQQSGGDNRPGGFGGGFGGALGLSPAGMGLFG